MTYDSGPGEPTAAGVALAPPPGTLLSGAAARYLKAMWYLSAGDAPLTVGRVAERVGVSHASASTSVKHLVDDGYADRGTDNHIVLGPAGEKEAIRLVRRHRLVETFLAVVLGLPWEDVHTEAENLEWVLSDDLVDRIAVLLGEPERNPHGDPIPSADGLFPELDDVPLADLEPGAKVRIVRVSNRDPELLRYVADEGLGIGTVVTVESQDPFEGPLWVRSSRGRHALGQPVVAAISVVRVGSDRGKTPTMSLPDAANG